MAKCSPPHTVLHHIFSLQNCYFNIIISNYNNNDKNLNNREMTQRDHVVFCCDEEEEVLFPPLSNESIREAVRLWCHDQAQAIEKYNHINKWNTSQVTDMSELFEDCKTFNDNISEWDVSNVTNIRCMFCCASSFNQDVSEWDVSNVRRMSYMFYGASSFNQDVSKWNVTNVRHMSYMFSQASSFNQDVSKWNVTNVRHMSYMFSQASSFNHDVSEWDVSNVRYMSCMFHNASSFNQDLSCWDVSSLIYAFYMFEKSPVESLLLKSSNVPSFFDGVFKTMPREERVLVFSCAFSWNRRESFVLFLAMQGYMQCGIESSDIQHNSYSCGLVAPCDVLLNIEDLYRYICSFL